MDFDLNGGKTEELGLPSLACSVPVQVTPISPPPDMAEVVPVTRGTWLTITTILRQIDERLRAIEAQLNGSDEPPISGHS